METLPAELPAPTASGIHGSDDQLLVSTLNGLVFVGTQEAVRPAGRTDAGIVVESVASLASDAFKRQLAVYLGRPLTLGAVRRITREIILYLRAADRPVVDVVVPEQNVSTGTLQVLVLEGRVGKIRVEGGRWVSPGSLRGQISVQPGEVITGSRLLADIGWLNQNPFRQVDLVFARGEQPGTTDVILRVTDRRPWRVYTGYEDSGNALTDDHRVLFGANWGAAFGTDQQLNYQLTASPDFTQMRAHSLSYVVPLRWRHTLTVFGSYAQSRPDLPDGVFTLDGTSWQVSMRYRVPLREWHGLNQEFTAGFDFKRSNNNLAFGGTQVFTQAADVAQFILNYSVTKRDKRGATSLDLTAAISPGGLTSHNDTVHFTALRSGATADYGYLRLAFERTTWLPQGFSWVAHGTAQWSSANLLGSEQLGLGGYTALRGYDEREINGDGGFILVNEVQTPDHKVGRGQLRGLVFLDGGVATIRDPLPGEEDRREAASAGLGLRYRLGATWSLRADYGWQLRAGVAGRRGSRAHIGTTLAY